MDGSREDPYLSPKPGPSWKFDGSFTDHRPQIDSLGNININYVLLFIYLCYI